MSTDRLPPLGSAVSTIVTKKNIEIAEKNLASKSPADLKSESAISSEASEKNSTSLESARIDRSLEKTLNAMSAHPEKFSGAHRLDADRVQFLVGQAPTLPPKDRPSVESLLAAADQVASQQLADAHQSVAAFNSFDADRVFRLLED